MDNFSTIIISVVVFVAVFLILREVFCWYWKINERISLQQEQNGILKKILRELERQSDQGTTPRDEKNTSYTSDDTSTEEDIDSLVLTADEQKKVDSFIKFGINTGERLVMNKTTRSIDRFNIDEWKNAEQSEWMVLIEN